MLVLCWITAFLWLTSLTDGAIVIERAPQSSQVRMGETTVLECVGRSGTDTEAAYRCSWSKDGLDVFVGEGKRRQHYDWAGDFRSGNCSVRLSNADVHRHQGRWKCTIANTESDGNEMASTASIMLTVLAAPTYPEIQDPSGKALESTTVLEHRATQLHCVSRHGNPAANLRWYLDERDISGTATFYNNSEPRPNAGMSGSTDDSGAGPARMYTAGSWLPLVVNRSDDGAVLRCVARHPAYADATQTTLLVISVVYPPTNASSASGGGEGAGSSSVSNVTVPFDRQVALSCPLEAKPEPVYAWYHQLRSLSSFVAASSSASSSAGSETDGVGSGGGDAGAVPVSKTRELRLTNVSSAQMTGGFFCTAFLTMDRQNHTAYSGLYVLLPPPTEPPSDDVFEECERCDITLSVVGSFGAFAFLSLLAEIVLFAYAKNHRNKPSSSRSPIRKTIFELYQTRGRKMALVHVRGEHDDKNGKGWTVHVSATLVSILMGILDIFTMAAFATSLLYCLDPASCLCTLMNPAVISTVAAGSVVFILEFIFLITFCVRKREESKYSTYARRKEDVPGTADNTDASPNGNPATAPPAGGLKHPAGRHHHKPKPPQRHTSERNDNNNPKHDDRNVGEMPGIVPA